MLCISQLLGCVVDLTLLSCVTRLTTLELVGQLFQLSLFVIMVLAGLGELVEQLDLVVLFNSVQLAELVQLCSQGIDHLEAFKQLLAAFLVAAILLSFGLVVLVLQVGQLIVKSPHVALLGAQLHYFLAQLVQQCILVPFCYCHRFRCLLPSQVNQVSQARRVERILICYLRQCTVLLVRGWAQPLPYFFTYLVS